MPERSFWSTLWSKPLSRREPDLSGVPCNGRCWLRSYHPGDQTGTTTQNDQFHAANRLQPQPSGVYRPIKAGRTRILCLKPGLRRDQLCIELFVVGIYQHGTVREDTGEEIHYEALSYSWGRTQAMELIECNGTALEVQQDLATALRWLRLTDSPRLLWVDAICINQTDEAEKSIQIQNMFTLFYRAEKGTVAWLGEKRECGVEAFRFLQESSMDQRHRRECVPGLVYILKGIHILCQRRWFRRTWVRQEVYAARTLCIQVQDETMAWDDFTERVASAFNRIAAHFDAFGVEERFKALCKPPVALSRLERAKVEDAVLLQDPNSRKAKLLSERYSLSRFVRGNIDFEATNERDFIYGLVSMTSVSTTSTVKGSPPGNAAEGSLLPVDYSRTVVHVFIDATRWLIQQSKFLDVILMAPHTQERCDDLCKARRKCSEHVWPSWVPDWRHMSSKMPFDAVWQLIDDSPKRQDHITWQNAWVYLGARTYQNGGYVTSMYNLVDPLPVDNHLALRCKGALLGRLRPRGYRGTRKVAKHYAHACEESIQSMKVFKDLFATIENLQEMVLDPDPCVLNDSVSARIYENTRQQYGMGTAYHYCTSDLRNSLLRGKCLVPSTAQDDDYVVMLDGTSLPAVMRPFSTATGASNYRLIGPLLSEAYCAEELARRRNPISSPGRWSYILKYGAIEPLSPVSAPMQDMLVREFRIV